MKTETTTKNKGLTIKNGVLVLVTAEAIIDGVFHNDEIVEVADRCFLGMPSLERVSLPNVKKIGSYCFRDNQALTEISLPALTTAGSYCFSYNQALTEISLLRKNLKTKCVDGYPFIIHSVKTSKEIKIYSGYNFERLDECVIEKHKCFVAEKRGFTAHGNTVKQAVGDLQFKIIAEKLKKDPINKNTIITIRHYRLITGACELGVRDWMAKNGITKEKIKASELLPLLEKTNAYGLDAFRKLVTF
jgi:hypothetical protein